MKNYAHKSINFKKERNGNSLLDFLRLCLQQVLMPRLQGPRESLLHFENPCRYKVKV